MAKRRKKPAKPTPETAMRPTPEREARGEFQSAGMARRLTPVIDTLLRTQKITRPEYDRLAYYRDQASIADKSPVKSGIDFTVRGSTNTGPGITVLSAAIETVRIERDMGNLWRIARAVAVDDTSLSQWCILQHGGRERYDSDGVFVDMVPSGGKDAESMALLELKMAALRISM